MRLCAMAVAVSVFAWACVAKGQTAFSYQGDLRMSGQPATGVFDLRFRLMDSAAGGNQIGSTACLDNVQVSEGRFTVSLDFGQAFSGDRWLEILVRADTGLTCASATGFAVLSPRQAVTPSPRALQAADSALLGGQGPAFYQNAGNLTGTVSDARLTANIPRIGGSQTFSGSNVFSSASNSFTGNGAGLTGLNAGQLVSGQVPDSRIGSNIPRLANANTFTGPMTISTATQFPLWTVSSFTGGSWQTLVNTSAGGREWNLISTGSGNGEGAGRLLIRDGTAGAVRMLFDTDGDVGIGTVAPAARLEVSGQDTRVLLRNTNDAGGGYFQNTFGSLQQGMYNPSAGAWGVIPAGGTRAFFGMDNQGRVGSLTNQAGGPPGFRNMLDDGSGNAAVVGDLSARNMPGVVHAWSGSTGSIANNNSVTLIENVPITVPASGFLAFTVTMHGLIDTYTAGDTWLILELKETTGGNETLVDSAYMSLGLPTGSVNHRSGGTITLTYFISTGPGTRTYKVRARHSGPAQTTGFYSDTEIMIMYFGRGL